MLRIWLKRVDWEGLVTRRRKAAGDWVSCRNMTIVRNYGKGCQKNRWNEVVKDDLKKCGLDRGLAKNWERWKAQIMGKSPTCPCQKRERDTTFKKL
jgi:hypothetical protein